MNRFRTFLIGALLALFAATPALAQTTLNSTTTNGAVTATQQIVTLTAVTSIALRDWILMDIEFMQVNAIDTTAKTVTVRRGVQGSAGRAHASGVVVWTGPPSRYYSSEVAGVCTATSEQFLPHIVVESRNIYECQSSEWTRTRQGGQRDTLLGRSDGGVLYPASGAIAIVQGLSLLTKAGVDVMTLAAPTTEQNGMIMTIVSTTAQAHTITVTPGFNSAGAAQDLGTFAAAIGNGITIMASNGVWIVIQNTGVTLS